MSPQALGIVIGGLIPAVLFGLSPLFAKAGVSAGIGLGPYLVIAGFAVVSVGVGVYWLQPETGLSLRSGAHAYLSGATYGLGSAGVVLALIRFGSPVSQLSPLYSMNPLVAVGLGLWLFSEWKGVGVGRLLLGTVLIVIGGSLVSTSGK